MNPTDKIHLEHRLRLENLAYYFDFTTKYDYSYDYGYMIN